MFNSKQVRILKINTKVIYILPIIISALIIIGGMILGGMDAFREVGTKYIERNGRQYYYYIFSVFGVRYQGIAILLWALIVIPFGLLVGVVLGIICNAYLLHIYYLASINKQLLNGISPKESTPVKKTVVAPTITINKPKVEVPVIEEIKKTEPVAIVAETLKPEPKIEAKPEPKIETKPEPMVVKPEPVATPVFEKTVVAEEPKRIEEPVVEEVVEHPAAEEVDEVLEEVVAEEAPEIVEEILEEEIIEEPKAIEEVVEETIPEIDSIEDDFLAALESIPEANSYEAPNQSVEEVQYEEVEEEVIEEVIYVDEDGNEIDPADIEVIEEEVIEEIIEEEPKPKRGRPRKKAE